MKCVLSKTPLARLADGDNDSMEGIKLLCLPYVKGISEKIKQGCQKLGIHAVFKSGNKLRQSLMKVKTEVDEDLKKGVIYEIPCGDCSQVYIGEMGRNLKERAPVCSQEGYEEWDCSTCLPTTQCGLGWSQSAS